MLVTLGKLVGVMYLGLALYVLIVVGGTAYLIRVPLLAFFRGDPRAVSDCVLDRQLRSGAAEGARGHGAVRRAEADRRVRAAGRLQLQPGRFDALHGDGDDLRRAARRAFPDARAAGGDRC